MIKQFRKNHKLLRKSIIYFYTLAKKFSRLNKNYVQVFTPCIPFN